MPQPELYNQHYINRYAFPRGLQAVRKPEVPEKNIPYKKSIYEVSSNSQRKGVSGWKLTKKLFPNTTNSSNDYGPSMASEMKIYPGMN
jgi:hypothetical protein